MFGDKPQKKLYAKLVYPKNGYDADVKNAEKLIIGEFYEVERVDMGQSRTGIQLTGIVGVFNSVQFKFYNSSKKRVDIYNMPEFNHYLFNPREEQE